jgi:hypothetical protein
MPTCKSHEQLNPWGEAYIFSALQGTLQQRRTIFSERSPIGKYEPQL